MKSNRLAKRNDIGVVGTNLQNYAWRDAGELWSSLVKDDYRGVLLDTL